LIAIREYAACRGMEIVHTMPMPAKVASP